MFQVILKEPSEVPAFEGLRKSLVSGCMPFLCVTWSFPDTLLFRSVCVTLCLISLSQAQRSPRCLLQEGPEDQEDPGTRGARDGSLGAKAR